jgi:hypothetical protein
MVEKNNNDNELKEKSKGTGTSKSDASDVKERRGKSELHQGQTQLSEKPLRAAAAATEAEGQTLAQRDTPEKSDAEKKQQPPQPLAEGKEIIRGSSKETR